MKTRYIIIGILLLSSAIKAQNMSLITYNIRLDVSSDGENAWDNRKDYLCSQLAFYNPDIFGIQEALPNQVIDMSKHLPQYNYIGIGRDGKDKGESSNIFYKKELFTIIEESTFWLSETPDILSKGWDAKLNRICTYGLFKNLHTNQLFWVFNTHLDHIGELAKTNAIHLILDKITSLNTKNYPVFFMGDFNTEPSVERMNLLKNQMLDTHDASITKPFGPTGTFNGFKYNESITKRIDYIFISKHQNIQVHKYAVLIDSKDIKFPSDHLPVYVEISVN